jgi:aryl-alcohol dehydrogenase-like predicted oxidoreductase
VLAQGPNVFVIPGARTVEHALDSVTAGRLALSAEDLHRLTAAEFDRR